MPFHRNVPDMPAGNVTVPDDDAPSNRMSTATIPLGVGIDARIHLSPPGCGAMTTDANPSESGRMPATPVSKW